MHQYTSNRLATLILCNFIEMNAVTVSKETKQVIAVRYMRYIDDALEVYDKDDGVWFEAPQDISDAYKEYLKQTR